MQDLELGFKNIYDKWTFVRRKCCVRMLRKSGEKTKKVEAWDSDGLSRGICACETREALVSLDLVHTIVRSNNFLCSYVSFFSCSIWWQRQSGGRGKYIQEQPP